jgi:type IV secretory pathway TrbF-like protein
MVLSEPNSSVAAQIQAYNQSVAEARLTVNPVVRYVSGGATDYQVDWDEEVDQPRAALRTQHAMRAYVTVAFDQNLVALHADPLLNPYGMYVRDLRVVEIK